MQKKDNHYKNNQNFYFNEYWKDSDGSNLYRPNGFESLPEDVYMAFLVEINKDGKVLDLGCGNGLMLKYLMTMSGYKLIPYGVDFMPPSIKQAKEILHLQHRANFTVGNVIHYSFSSKGPFDFIFVPLHHIDPADRINYLNKIKRAIKKNGKIIFYEYADSLRAERQDWIGGYQELKNWQLERKDYPGVSIAIWKN